MCNVIYNMVNGEMEMKIKNFFNDIVADYYKMQEYKRVFNNLCKVRDNPIQDFIDNKISFKELAEGMYKC